MSPVAVVAHSLACPALFGKLPGHGDFISRGVDGTLGDQIDSWLSNWMALGRKRAGAEFDDLYLTAAPWLRASKCTSAVLMPSLDSVGRKYPLLAICAAGAELQNIYDLLVQALAGAWNSDRLRDGLAALEPSDAMAPQDGWFLPEGAGQALPSPCAAEGWAEVLQVFA